MLWRPRYEFIVDLNTRALLCSDPKDKCLKTVSLILFYLPLLVDVTLSGCELGSDSLVSFLRYSRTQIICFTSTTLSLILYYTSCLQSYLCIDSRIMCFHHFFQCVVCFADIPNGESSCGRNKPGVEPICLEVKHKVEIGGDRVCFRCSGMCSWSVGYKTATKRCLDKKDDPTSLWKPL